MSQSLRHVCRKVVAVGRNYIEHARELGNEIGHDPVVFLKPPTSIIEVGEKIRIPSGATEIHHEVELGLVIGKQLCKAHISEIGEAISGFVVALDMTDRALQNKLKSLQLPWTLAKCFDTSCPVGPVLPSSALPFNILSERPDPHGPTLGLWLQVNGQERQRGSVAQMVHSPVRLISFISHCMRLEPGDLILTGTPAGVGPVRSGDVIRAGIDQLCDVEFPII